MNYSNSGIYPNLWVFFPRRKTILFSFKIKIPTYRQNERESGKSILHSWRGSKVATINILRQPWHRLDNSFLLHTIFKKTVLEKGLSEHTGVCIELCRRKVVLPDRSLGTLIVVLLQSYVMTHTQIRVSYSRTFYLRTPRWRSSLVSNFGVMWNVTAWKTTSTRRGHVL